MSFANLVGQTGKVGIWILELDLDEVTSTTAAENDDGSYCYNTPNTSQSFTPLTIETRTVSFCSQYSAPMSGYPRQMNPTIANVSWNTDKLRVGRGLANFGTIDITLHDHIDSDRVEDPYYDVRDPQPAETSYWRRKIRRVRYFDGRDCRVSFGYREDIYDASNFKTLNALIKDVSIDRKGMVRIRAINPLSESFITGGQVPEQVDFSLGQDITAGDTTWVVNGDLTDYQGSQTIRIEDELVEGSISGNDFTATARGFAGTTAKDHEEDEAVTIAYHAQGYVDEVIANLMTGPGQVDSAYIPTADWQAERERYLEAYLFDVWLSEDDTVQDLIGELCEQCGIYLWFDWIDNEFKLRAISPESPENIIDLTDTDLLQGISEKVTESERVSQVITAHGRRSQVADLGRAESFSVFTVGSARGVGDGQHKKNNLRYIRSRWFDEDQSPLALRTSFVISSHFEDGLETYTFELDADVVENNDIDLSKTLRVESIDFVEDGEAVGTKTMQVVRMTQKHVGHSWQMECIRSPFSGRFCFFMADGSPTYDNATESERNGKAGWFAADDGSMPNGDPAYLFQ